MRQVVYERAVNEKNSDLKRQWVRQAVCERAVGEKSRDLKRQWPPPPVSTLLAGSGTWPHVRSRAGSSGIGALTEMALVLGGIIVYLFLLTSFRPKNCPIINITNCKSDTKINDFADYVPLNLF